MKDGDFTKLAESIRQAGEIRRGERKASRTFLYEVPDVKALRKRLGVSQAEMAVLIGVSPRTLQNWEQGRRTPEGPARALLRAVQRNPKAVLEALQA
jgi:putative transcriptional regulator